MATTVGNDGIHPPGRLRFFRISGNQPVKKDVIRKERIGIREYRQDYYRIARRMPTPRGSGRSAEIFRNPAAFIISAISRAVYARPPPVTATMWTEKKTGPGGEVFPSASRNSWTAARPPGTSAERARRSSFTQSDPE